MRSLRYGRMPDTSPEELCEALCDDVLALRAKRPDLRVTFLCDGAHDLWALLEQHLSGSSYPPPGAEGSVSVARCAGGRWSPSTPRRRATLPRFP